MADFVGLLKKTIEAQSQMTPRLRQRVYERAHATVERKLTESQAPLAVIERQRQILNQAIDEVEAYYQERDKHNEAEVRETDSLADEISAPSPQGAKKNEIAAGKRDKAPAPLEKPIATEAGNNAPSPVNRPQNQQSLNPALSVISAPPGFLPDKKNTSPAKVKGQRKRIEESSLPQAEAILPNMPSLATFLSAEKKVNVQNPSPLPPDLPFLQNNGEKKGASGARFIATGLSPLSAHYLGNGGVGNSLKVPPPPSIGDLLASSSADNSASAQDQERALTEGARQPISSVNFVSHNKQSPLSPQLPQPPLQRPPLLEDYLPHWSENENLAASSPIGEPPLAGSGLDPELTARVSAQSEIDKSRREIEALREGKSVIDELPFSTPNDAPWLPTNQNNAGYSIEEKGEKTSLPHDGDLDSDPMSEIFVQAARREQKQSGRKRRIMAMMIGLIVAAVLAAIVGILVLTNGYQPNDEAELIAQEARQDSSSNYGAEGSNEVTDDRADPINNGQAKITRRLLPGGQETDPGLALDAARPGEGSSQTNASVTTVDNSARAVFYEAQTETLAATANEGRVEWQLRRTAAPSPDAQTPSGQSSDQDVSIIGNVNIPSLGMTLRLTLRYNNDETMPADYLAEVIFAVPDDFEGEAIADISPLMFKASEQSTGQDLAGMTTAKVQDNLFLMAVRAPRPILERNLALMRQLPWLKLNVLYKNGRVGEFSIAKGEGGSRIFQQAIDEWSRRAATRMPNAMIGQEPEPALPNQTQAEQTQSAPIRESSDFAPSTGGIQNTPVEGQN